MTCSSLSLSLIHRASNNNIKLLQNVGIWLWTKVCYRYIYTYTYTYISRTSRIIILYNEIKDVKEKYQFTKELNEFEAGKVVCSMVKLSVTKVDAILHMRLLHIIG